MYIQPNYTDILAKNYPTLVFVCYGDITYDNIEIISGGDKPEQATLDTLLLTEKKDRMWLEIQVERTRRQNGGAYVASVNKWFHSDQTSRIQQLGLLMMGQNMPNNIMWKTMDGTFVLMTPTLAAQIFNAVATLDITAFAVAEQHRAAMLQSATPETYDFSAGWPQIFGE